MNRLISLFVILTVLSGLVSSHKVEIHQADEESHIQNIWKTFHTEINDVVASNSSNFQDLRLAHVKQHGCVRATFTADPHLESDLRVGPLFSNPGKSFDVLARFSSGKGGGFSRNLITGKRDNYDMTSDLGLDNRAIAIKIFGVTGQQNLGGAGLESANTIDFTFTTSTCAFTHDILESNGYFSAVNSGPWTYSKFVLGHPAVAKNLAETGASGLVESLTNAAYSSSAPLAFGPDKAVRLRLRPLPSNSKLNRIVLPPKYWHNAFRHLLNRAISKSRGQGYVLEGQFYVNEKVTPVENGQATWNTPWRRLGELIIDSTELNDVGPNSSESFCRAATFNPWNTDINYQPVGGIQRIRKVVYTEIQKVRRQYQIQMGKNIVDPKSSVQDITWAQVEKALPINNAAHHAGARRHEAEIDEAEVDEAEVDEAEMDQFEHHQQQHHHNPQHHGAHVSVTVDV